MARATLPALSLTEWVVLALAAEKPIHGFAIAKELSPDADLGRIWTVSRPLVYQALATLERHNLVEPAGVEAGDRGPTRTRIRATRAGKTAVDRWLETPVPHVRDLRSRLLLQLRLLDRKGLDVRPLAATQLEHLSPILASLNDQATSTSGFDRLLAFWRYESAQAAARVLQGVLAEEPALASAQHPDAKPRSAPTRRDLPRRSDLRDDTTHRARLKQTSLSSAATRMDKENH
ncbi:MAG TPA: PadR family transcriptional regulator [Acidimicrobiales bacterium]|nr:PadR family transcriptional regulator [Acidimicrobiales bacterium]